MALKAIFVSHFRLKMKTLMAKETYYAAIFLLGHSSPIELFSSTLPTKAKLDSMSFHICGPTKWPFSFMEPAFGKGKLKSRPTAPTLSMIEAMRTTCE